MTTQEIARRLVELVKEGKDDDAIHTLFSPDIVSVESRPMPDGNREMKGTEAVLGKGAWFVREHEIHSVNAEGPLVAAAHFCVHFQYDVTHKASGQRRFLDELAVYHVAGGKVVREEFFYSMG